MENDSHASAFERWPWARTVGRNTHLMSAVFSKTVETGSMYAICGKCVQTFQSMDIPDDSKCPECGAEGYRKNG